MKKISEFLGKIIGSEKTEEVIKSRRKFAIILTAALVVASGAVLSVLLLNNSDDTVKTASVLSDSIEFEEITDEAQDNNGGKSETATAPDKSTKKSVTTTTSVKSKRIKGTTTTYKKYNEEFLITADTNADPYIEKIAAARSYETRKISKERHTVKNIDTGEMVTSDGFDILCQVVNGEMGPSFSSEALKAQAVAAYTTILYCESTGQTPELGLNKNYGEKIESAVKAVEGLVLTYNGKPINAVFSASSAGVTASSVNAWGGYLPYLRSVESKYDKDDSNFGIKMRKALKEVEMKLRYQLGIDLTNDPAEWMSITKTYDGRYVKEVTFCDGKKVTGDFIKALFNLKSNAFIISYKTSTGFIFTTYGYGHGVGMSQEGANLYAIKDGLKFDQILKHYYPGASINLSDSDDDQTTTEVSKKKTTTAKTTTAKNASKTTKRKTTKATTKSVAEPTKTVTSTTLTEPQPQVTELESPAESTSEYEPTETPPQQSEPVTEEILEKPPEELDQQEQAE